MALGVGLLAEGFLAVRFHVGGTKGLGWGRVALLAFGTILTLSGFVALRRTRLNQIRPQLSRVATASWPLLLALFVYLVAFVVMNPLAAGDQSTYELESMTLAYHQSRDLAHSYTDSAWTQMIGSSPPGHPLTPHGEAAYYTADHELIHAANVGPAVLLTVAVPWVELVAAVAPSKARWPWNIEMILLAAISAQLLYRLLRRFRPRRPVLTTAVWASTVFCAPMVVYASQVYPEVPAMLAALIVAECLTRKPTIGAMVVGSVAASAMPWIHVRFFLVAVLLVLGLGVRAMSIGSGRDRSAKSLARAVAPVAVPFVASMALMAIAFQAWYGSPWITAPYRGGIREPHTLVASYVAMAQLFWGSQTGLFPVAPVGLLALVAIPLFCRRNGRWALFALLVAAVYVLNVVVEGAVIGGSFAGRYLVWLIPFGSVPLLFLVTEYRAARWVFEALAVVSGWLALWFVLQPPFALVSANAAINPMWLRLVAQWPALSGGGYADLPSVAVWTAGVLAVAGGIYAAAMWGRRPAAAPRVGLASGPGR